jgi:hypothetical protein
MTVKFMRTAIPLVIMACLAMTADAGLTSLPTSSFRSGTSYKSTATQACRVEFAVYDTTTYPNDLTGSSLSNPGTGRYVYAYQIFNYAASIPFFVIQGLGVNAVANNDIDIYSSGANSVKPTSSGLSVSQTSVVFEFNGGILSSGTNSWYLVLSSDQGPVTGSYKLTAPTDDDMIKPDVIAGDGSNSGNAPLPEPASMFLMGLGAVALFKRKQK